MTDPILVGKVGGLRAAFLTFRSSSLFDVVLVVACACCFVLSFLVGNHYPPWMNAYNDFVSALTLLLLATIALRATGGRLRVPRSAVVVAVLSALPLVQVAAGQIIFAGDAWVAFLYLFGLALAIVVGANTFAKRRQGFLAVGCTLWLVAALVSCLIILVQRFVLDVGNIGLFIWDVKPGNAPFGNLGQPNQMSTFLVLSLVGLGFLYESRVVGPATTWAAVALIVPCIAMTQSRAAVLMLAGIALVIIFRNARFKLKTPRWAGIAVLMLWSACYFLLPIAFKILGLHTNASLA